MTTKDLKKLSRAELLEIMMAQSKEIDALRAQVEELQAKLDDRTLDLKKVGSIAEAALVLNHVFADAQKAANQYVENVYRLADKKAAELGVNNHQKPETTHSTKTKQTGKDGQ